MCSALPSTVEFDLGSPFTCGVKDRTKSESYKTQLSTWQDAVKGDLKALRGVEQPRWSVYLLHFCSQLSAAGLCAAMPPQVPALRTRVNVPLPACPAVRLCAAKPPNSPTCNAAENELGPIKNWLCQRIWGYCLMEVLRRHPDFEAMRPALRGLSKINMWKVIFSLREFASKPFVLQCNATAQQQC